MEKLAGSQAEEAYKQNFAVLQTQIDAYLNGSISGEKMVKWSQNFNDKLKSMGAESDIIEIQKLLKLERNIIGSGGADKNAW